MLLSKVVKYVEIIFNFRSVKFNDLFLIKLSQVARIKQETDAKIIVWHQISKKAFRELLCNDFMNFVTDSVSFFLKLLVLVWALGLGSCEKLNAQKFNKTNHTDLKPDIIINLRMEMTWDIGQEVAEPLLLTEDGHQITARGWTQTQMARPSNQIKLKVI